MRVELMHMAFDMLATHGCAFGVLDLINVCDVLTHYALSGERPTPPEKPTVN
jgi:hypothetical protein